MSKRSAVTIAPGLLISVMTVMKAAYGAVPKACWGLSHAGEACIAGGTSRGFTIDNPDSFDYYCRQFTHPGAYSIVSLRTAGRFNKRITILETVRRVTLGVRFNSEIVFSSAQILEDIEFDKESAFNRPIVVPTGVRTLVFGKWFNQTTTFPASLRRLEVGERYTGPLDLPQGLLELYLGDRFNRWCELPASIRVLRCGSNFCQHIPLPQSLRDVEFGRNYIPTVALPQGLQRVRFRHASVWTIQSIMLPNSVKYANIGTFVNIDPQNLPVGLEELVWHQDIVVNIPLTVKRLTLGERFQQPLNLPPGLESIVFLGDYCRHRLNLPRGLQSITLNNDSTATFVLPDGCVRLYIDSESDEE